MGSDLRVKFSAFYKRALCVAVLLFAQGVFADETETSVGRVGLVLGKAYLESADSSRERIRVGATISVSDKIVTEANGHVHIRFFDDAMVSVRPDSTLEIERYDYNPAKPEQSAIKLNLVEGVTRAISGRGAHAARDRFRLNTPIAAIGVRGTDFVVGANDLSVRALVSEGAIVMAPFSNDCLASSFGPCSTNAVELTQESLQVVQMDESTPLPRLLPAQDARGSLSLAVVEVASADAHVESKMVDTGVYLETITSRKVTEVASNTIATIVPGGPEAPKPPAVIDFTPQQLLVSAALSVNQLAWGRWTDGQGSRERITSAREVAAQGREITVGSNLPGAFAIEYGLFRTQNGKDQVASGLGVVSFGLDSAQAFYHSATGMVVMQVNSGKLNIDFNQSNFSTQLGLSHASTGKIDFSAAGSISDGGAFTGNTDIQTMAGAVSLDGKEAGYFFDKQLDDGRVQGLTLWDAQ